MTEWDGVATVNTVLNGGLFCIPLLIPRGNQKMDPVTMAIIAAVEAGANSAAGDVAKKALVDCYDGLKSLLIKKFGTESDVAEALDKLEKQPDAKGRRQTVQDELVAVDAGADPELLKAAQALVDQIKSRPGGEQHITNVQGDLNVVADRGSSASINISGSVGKRE